MENYGTMDKTMVLSQDENSPFSQLKHFWMSTIAHGMFTEIQISGTVQWPFSGHSVPLNAAEWQAHFSDHLVFFFLFSG